MTNIIETEDLRFEYTSEEEGARVVLNGVDLSIRKGEFVAVLGHNGSGKSTLAKHFNAMLLPSGGKCFVAGMDTADEEKRFDIRQTVGMVLQNPDNQLVATIVEEDVAFGPENMGVPPEEIRKRVDEALKAVGMYEYRRHAPHKLSGGQKQRIAIAGIIAMQPACIVLDEPTAMLEMCIRDSPIVDHQYLGAPVEGKDLVIVDDMISSGDSVLEIAERVKGMGANRVFVCTSFGLFCEGLERFDEAYELSLIHIFPVLNARR